MDNLYVTGGRQRHKLIMKEEEWNLYEKALILHVNVQDGTASTCVEYESPLDVCASDGAPSFLFKAGTLFEDKLYVCTGTEILTYQLPNFQQTGYISLPCFNDLHHVALESNGNLLVVSTGLDMVVEVTPDGKVLQEWSVLGEDPWNSFSKDIDYRRVATTKPHKSHPNFAFQLGTQIWVTRCNQKDALCLTEQGHTIPLSKVCVHDGHLYKGKLYFTSVDGTVIVVDSLTQRILEVIDLKQIDNPERALLGWCRGLHIVDERTIWVGFTRVRKTKFQEKVNWVKHVFHDTEKPTHMTLYDICAKKCLREIDLEKYGLNVLFGIFPAHASG